MQEQEMLYLFSEQSEVFGAAGHQYFHMTPKYTYTYTHRDQSSQGTLSPDSQALFHMGVGGLSLFTQFYFKHESNLGCRLMTSHQRGYESPTLEIRVHKPDSMKMMMKTDTQVFYMFSL